MARPDNFPEWATSGTLNEPNAGAKATGWLAQMRPPFGWMNWWMNLVYLWLVYLDAYAIPTPAVGYAYASAIQLSTQLGPAAGGWTVFEGGADYQGGPPRAVRSVSNTARVLLQYPLGPLWPHNDDAANTITIVSMTMLYARANSSSTVIARLMRAKRDGTGTTGTVGSVTGTSTTGAFVELSSAALNHVLDILYVYWLEVELDPDAAQDDARIAHLTLISSKTRVE